MIIDLHNHTARCNHAVGSEEEYIKEAIKNNIDIFGFSDHAPMKFDYKNRMTLAQCDEYENKINSLKTKYKKDILILLAYEVDYLLGYMEDRVLQSNVDYLIGSVHFINKWGFDNPEFISKYQNQNIDKIWEDYFLAITNLAKCDKFQIVGHLDLIKVFKFLPKKDIRLIAKDALQEIKNYNLAIEINGSGFDKPIKEQYPSKEILEICFEMGIDITFSSDAHNKDEINLYNKKCTNLAKSIGYKEMVYFKDREKIRVAI